MTIFSEGGPHPIDPHGGVSRLGGPPLRGRASNMLGRLTLPRSPGVGPAGIRP